MRQVISPNFSFLWRPFNSVSSISKSISTFFTSAFLSSKFAASSVPPVASRSSIIKTLEPFLIACS